VLFGFGCERGGRVATTSIDDSGDVAGAKAALVLPSNIAV
jgi:hypothetical protein